MGFASQSPLFRGRSMTRCKFGFGLMVKIVLAYFDGGRGAPSASRIAKDFGGQRSRHGSVYKVVTAWRQMEADAYDKWCSQTRLEGRIECDATTLRWERRGGQRHCLQLWGAVER